jgi:tetratricopeptide (TPR) repeat protein
MENNKKKKTTLTFMDLASVSSVYVNPIKAWQELANCLINIYKNFTKSHIGAEELQYVIMEYEKNQNNIPDVTSINYLVSTINRYTNDYKIPSATTLFLEFKRHCAIYLFSVGSQEKALEILKEIITAISDTIGGNTNNVDINLICVKDCVKLNLASIHFWREDLEESRLLLEEVITYYESTNEDLYLIKMVNFINVAFTYLAWIYTKNHEFEDAEKAFLHALKVIGLVKRHTKEKLKEDNFINTKPKKIFIYDQLINFYSYIQQFDMCQKPLNEILKIMDKRNFNYDVDIGPVHNVYYYITAALYAIKADKVDLSRILHYLICAIKVIYNYSDNFEMIPTAFYQQIFLLIEVIHKNTTKNNDKTIFYRYLKKPFGGENDHSESDSDDSSEVINFNIFRIRRELKLLKR